MATPTKTTPAASHPNSSSPSDAEERYIQAFEQARQPFYQDAKAAFAAEFTKEAALAVAMWRSQMVNCGQAFAERFQHVAVKADRQAIRQRLYHWFSQRVGGYVGKLLQTTQQALIDLVQEAAARGETKEQIAQRLESQYRVWTDARAELLATTATVAASNYGTLLGGEGNPTRRKRWVAVLDEKTRPDHRAANGQERAQNEPFDVGGYAMEYPGDTNAPIEEWVNCRCQIAFVDDGQQVAQIKAERLGVFAPLCVGCRWFHQVNTQADTCAAYPNGIPHAILTGRVDHRRPFSGDAGFRFNPVDRLAASYAAEWFHAQAAERERRKQQQ